MTSPRRRVCRDDARPSSRPPEAEGRCRKSASTSVSLPSPAARRRLTTALSACAAASLVTSTLALEDLALAPTAFCCLRGAVPDAPRSDRRWRPLPHPVTCSASSSAGNGSDDIEIVLPRHYSNDSSLSGVAGGIASPYPSVLHSVHVSPLLTEDESSRVLELSNAYAEESGCWSRGPDEDRHAAYATVDFPVEDALELEKYLDEIDFHQRILGKMTDKFGVGWDDMEYLDFFCANYEAKAKAAKDENGENGDEEERVTMDRLAPHRDGSLLSYTVLLNPPASFEGGGTIFDALRDVVPDPDLHRGALAPGGVVRPNRAGDCVLHTGKALHGADPVTAGTRTVLVGFVDVADRCKRYGALANACREWGRVDVMAKRLKRQETMTTAKRGGCEDDSASPAFGWVLQNDRYLPNCDTDEARAAGEGRSHVRGFAPAFSSVRRRGEPDYQRRRKLEVEDLLLREILLPEDERDAAMLFGGDVTVL